jgi:ABC-type phosphate/phosphonate transport system substrate-binding protein
MGNRENKRTWSRLASCPGAVLAALALGAVVAWPVRSAAAPSDGAPVRIGVIATRPKAQAAWQPLAAALQLALPDRRFEVEALDFPELEAAIAAQRLELVITNPSHYVAIRSRQPMSGVLATVIEQVPGVPLPASARHRGRLPSGPT